MLLSNLFKIRSVLVVGLAGRQFVKQLAELVSDHVQLVATNLETDALLVQSQAMLVDRFDALDDLVNGGQLQVP